MGIDYINDFYKKKEQFIFNQRLVEQGEEVSTNKEIEKEKTIELLNINNIATLNKSDFVDRELVLDEDTLEKILKKSKELMLISQKSEIKYIDKEQIQNLKVYLSKGKNYFIKNVEINKDNISKVKGRVALESSNLLGVYKKYTIKNLKTKLINLFIKGEKRYVNLDLYNKTLFDQKVEEEGKDYAREYFRDNNLNSTKENEIELAFVESCGKSWYDIDFEAKFDWDKEVNDLLIEKGLNGTLIYDNKSQILSYESKYKNTKKKIHKRNILTGVMKDEKKDLEKGNNFGLYVQKIKSLY